VNFYWRFHRRETVSARPPHSQVILYIITCVERSAEGVMKASCVLEIFVIAYSIGILRITAAEIERKFSSIEQHASSLVARNVAASETRLTALLYEYECFC
jgi:hypothetical protein